MKVAVVGAGLAGRLVALEIAEAGHEVDLFGPARAETGLGRIQLGYGQVGLTEAPPPAFLARGAAAFRPLVERWTERAVFEEHGSADMLYALPAGAGLPPEAAQAHFSDVSRQLASLSGPFPLGVEARGWRRLQPREMDDLFDPAVIIAAFATREGAIDPDILDAALDAAIATHPRLLRHGDRSASGTPGHQGSGPVRGRHDYVVDNGPALSQPEPERLLLRRQDERSCRSLPSLVLLGQREAGLATFRDACRIAWPGHGQSGRGAALATLRQFAPSLADAVGPVEAWDCVTAPGPTAWHGRADGPFPADRIFRLPNTEPTLAPLLASVVAARILGRG